MTTVNYIFYDIKFYQILFSLREETTYMKWIHIVTHMHVLHMHYI